jgi:hypothetical protein
MAKNLEILELPPDAARQYIDARAAFSALEAAHKQAQQVRGGMVWKTVQGKDYLIRTSPRGTQHSLGPRSTETEAMHAKFSAQKESASTRLSSLKDTVARHQRMNRALRVGRMPPIAVDILRRLADAQLDTFFRVVGTHALYAYEMAAGVSLASEITSTQDIDLLWDTRKRVTFAQRLAQDAPSMLGALQKVDKTFQLREDQRYTAINANGFQVDILRRVAEDDDPHPVSLSDAEDDFWVVQAHRASDLLNAREFSEIVVATNGSMARLTTIHPADFIQFKRWMATQTSREAIKRRRDALQADAVEWLLNERLPQLMS